jgi:hypothetical protein
MPEPAHTVYTVSANKALNKGLQLHIDTNVGGCLWHHFVCNWGLNTIMCSMPKVHLVWVDLPPEIPSPISYFWQALTNMVTASRLLNIAEVKTVCGDSRHSGNGGAYLTSNMLDIVSVPTGYDSMVVHFIGR